MKLVLENGTEMLGHSFGANKSVCGEVVFNTGMAGYIETLTDPSYCGQILTTTYPLIGNYGVPGLRNQQSIEPPFESNRIQVQGLIVQNYINDYSHHSARQSLQVINIPRTYDKLGRPDGCLIRRRATDSGVPLITDLQLARAVVEALRWKSHPI